MPKGRILPSPRSPRRPLFRHKQMAFFPTEKRGGTRGDGPIGDGDAPCHSRGNASYHGRRVLGFGEHAAAAWELGGAGRICVFLNAGWPGCTDRVSQVHAVAESRVDTVIQLLAVGWMMVGPGWSILWSGHRWLVSRWLTRLSLWAVACGWRWLTRSSYSFVIRKARLSTCWAFRAPKRQIGLELIKDGPGAWWAIY